MVLHWSNKWNPNFMEYVEWKEATNDAAGNAVRSQRMYERVSQDKYAIGWGALMHIQGTCVNPDGTKCPGYPNLKVLAISRDPFSRTVGLSELAPATTVILAQTVLRERLGRRQGVGVVVALGALALLARLE